jgi:hypothetical protein
MSDGMNDLHSVKASISAPAPAPASASAPTLARGAREHLRGRTRACLRVLVVVALTLAAARCGTSSAESSAARAAEAKPAAQPAAPAAGGSAGAVPHGDHSPHHGGAVLMLRDLHYEIVFEPGGRVAVFFTDAVRKDLPASVVSDVYIEIDRPKHKVERIEMAIDAVGESWEGKAQPVKQDDAMVRVAFTFQGEATSVDLPYKLYWKPTGTAAPAAPAGGTH